MKEYNILETAENVLRIEADSISALINRLDENFEKMVDCLIGIKGKVILTGMGKSSSRKFRSFKRETARASPIAS